MSDLGLDIPIEGGAPLSPNEALDIVQHGVETKPRISTREEAAKLSPGTSFIGPDGKERVVPYKVSHPHELADIPDGSDFVGPDGKLRQKPKYGGVGFSAQTLYDIAHSDKGRKMALEKFYPGKVQDDPSGGYFIEDQGKLLKPGRGVSKYTGAVASEAIPTVLSGAGGLIGGAAGTALEPGGGTVLGGAAGGYGGGYMGQRINDIFAQLAGVYDPEGGEANARTAGYVGAAGDVGGRALSAAAPTVKEGLQFATRQASKTANKFLGTDPQALETGIKIASKGEEPSAGPFGLSKAGTEVSPSAIFKSSPHLVNVTETLAQKFDASKNYKEYAEKYMDSEAKNILASKDIGALVEGSLTHPTAAVPTEEAGAVLKESARLRAIGQSAEADRQLAEVLANRRAVVEAKHAPDIEAHRARNESVVTVAEQAKKSAEDLLQHGFDAIEKEADDAFKVAKAGYNSGDLMRSAAEKMVQADRALKARAGKMYGDANTASGGLVPPRSGELAGDAQALIDKLPEGFEAAHPSIVNRIRSMAGVTGPDGAVVKPPVEASWSELHELRTRIRSDIKWNDLDSDVRNGELKHLEGKINAALHDVENAPELKEASQLLKLADGFYRENVIPLRHQQINMLVKALSTPGVQADPKALLNIAIRDGKSEVANLIKKHVGPQVWDAMRGADVKEMLAQSKQLDGSIDGLKFADKVVDRYRNGVLGVLHGEQGAAKLQQQALYIQQLRGKLPITARPGDTANDIILRARSAAADAERIGKDNPLKALQNEMKKVEAAAKKEFAANRKPDPLAFLNNATVGANAAVDKILGDPDLIVAASRAFPGGEKSAEFQLMRQIWTQRFLSETMEPGKQLAATSPEIQALMFPGVTLDDMHMLAKEMKLLMGGATMRGGGDTGSSMMAQSAVENPAGRVSGLGKLAAPFKLLPGGNFAMRAMLTAYYNTVRGVLTSPSTLRWLRKGLTSSDPQAKEVARAELRAYLQRGGAVGASATENVYQGSGPE
jgi:hypothetical protein